MLAATALCRSPTGSRRSRRAGSALDNFAALLGDGPRFASRALNTDRLRRGHGRARAGHRPRPGHAAAPRRRGGAVAAQATVFLPAVVAGVATALMWGWIFNPRFGLLNGLLGDRSGIEGPAWLRDPAWAMPAMVADGPVERRHQRRHLHRRARHGPARPARGGRARRRRPRSARFRYVTWPALTAGHVLPRHRQRDRRVPGLHAEPTC